MSPLCVPLECDQFTIRFFAKTIYLSAFCVFPLHLCLHHGASRWIKFEEKVEKGGERWSKPHVATLSLHSLMELKTYIEKGTILLDIEASTLPQVVGKWSWPYSHLTHKKSNISQMTLSWSLMYPFNRDYHWQPDWDWSVEGRPEGEGDIHAVKEASPPDQEVQLAFSCWHRQECFKCKPAVFQPRKW